LIGTLFARAGFFPIRIQAAANLEHPHGLSDRDFDSLYITDKPIIFSFHGYPWLINRLADRRTNHRNMRARGYKRKGHHQHAMELARGSSPIACTACGLE